MTSNSEENMVREEMEVEHEEEQEEEGVEEIRKKRKTRTVASTLKKLEHDRLIEKVKKDDQSFLEVRTSSCL